MKVYKVEVYFSDASPMKLRVSAEDVTEVISKVRARLKHSPAIDGDARIHTIQEVGELL